jgi:hypothetical protein
MHIIFLLIFNVYAVFPIRAKLMRKVKTSLFSQRYNELILKRYPPKSQSNSVIKISAAEKARMIAHSCESATLCTHLLNSKSENSAFGFTVSYVLDERGWPIFSVSSSQKDLAENLKINRNIALHCHSLKDPHFDMGFSIGRVTFMGHVIFLSAEESISAQYLFDNRPTDSSNSKNFQNSIYFKLQPNRIHLSQNEELDSEWIDVNSYENAEADILGKDLSSLLRKYNEENIHDLGLVVKHIVGITDAVDLSDVKLLMLDKYGIVLGGRLNSCSVYNKYHIGFENTVSSVEDAKSELAKLFQESWEKEHASLVPAVEAMS